MATRTWDNGAASGLWSVAANWSADTKPGSGDIASFDATSVADCLINEAINVSAFNSETTYTGTQTGAVSLTHAVSGIFYQKVNNKFVAGVGSTWNIGGDFNTPTTVRANYAGATINLTGTSKAIVGICSNSQTGGIPIVNITGSYAQDNGEFSGVDVHVKSGGTLSAAAELNVNRLVNTLQCRIYNEPGGTVSGVGTMIFCYNSVIAQQDGTWTLILGIFAPTDDMRVVPGTYNCDVIMYNVNSSVTTRLYWTAGGTYNFTGTNSFATLNDISPSVGVFAWNIPSTTVINASHTTVKFQYTGGTNGTFNWYGAGWFRCVSATTCAFTPSETAMGNVEFATTGTATIQDAYIGATLKVSSGTYNGNGKAHTLRDDWWHTGGNYTAAGFAGATWTVGGCVRLVGTAGNILALNPNSGWNLVLSGGPLYTYRVDYAAIKNLTVTGGTLYAVNCTDGGGNSGVTFGSSPPTSNAVVWRLAQSPSAGAHLVEPRLSGSAITAYVDGTATAFEATTTINQASKNWGLLSYYSGSYTLCPLDNFNVPLTTITPPAPTDLAVTNKGVATWGPVVGATSYTIRRSVANAGSWTTTYTGTAFTYQDTIPAASGDYDYQIAAVDEVGTGAYSASVVVTYPVDPVEMAFDAYYSPIFGGYAGWYGDTSRTTPVSANGAAVSDWDDRSGGGFHIQQPTDGVRPALETGALNGLTAVVFDGTQERLWNTSFNGMSSITSCNIMVLGKFLDFVDASQYMISFEQSGGASGALALTAYTTTIFISTNTGETIYGSLAYSNTGYHLFDIRYDGSLTGNANRLKFYIDGVQQTLTFTGTVPSSITLANGIGLGINGTSGGVGNSKIVAAGVRSPILNSTEQTNANYFFKTYLGGL